MWLLTPVIDGKQFCGERAGLDVSRVLFTALTQVLKPLCRSEASYWSCSSMICYISSLLFVRLAYSLCCLGLCLYHNGGGGGGCDDDDNDN